VILRRSWLVLVLFLLLFTKNSLADFTLTPRYDYITSQDEELANRLMVNSKLSASAGYFGIYVDGFGEFDADKDQAEIRHAPNRGYLQEAYLEFKMNSIYIRLGQQAMRWSEMWVVPSLDIWTGRRWNRLYYDPVPEQLAHSTGASFSYATQGFTLDLVGITNLAQNTYPEPLPETMDSYYPNESSGGARMQFDVAGFHFGGLAAKQQKKYVYGISGNYAFDSAVPKFEAGMSDDRSDILITGREYEYFGSFGVDLFFGNWVFTPQLTLFDFGDLNQRDNDYESVYYISGQRKVDPHDFEFMGFVNTTTQESFWNMSYAYSLTNYFTLGGFVQQYYGPYDTLTGLFRDIAGPGLIAGFRLEILGNLPF